MGFWSSCKSFVISGTNKLSALYAAYAVGDLNNDETKIRESLVRFQNNIDNK